MTENDKSLIKQLMKAGRYNAIYDLMPAYNLQKSRDLIANMGSKWCCHKDNQIKRLATEWYMLSRRDNITDSRMNHAMLKLLCANIRCCDMGKILRA